MCMCTRTCPALAHTCARTLACTRPCACTRVQLDEPKLEKFYAKADINKDGRVHACANLYTHIYAHGHAHVNEILSHRFGAAFAS